MFTADTAPNWADGRVCHRCRVEFTFTNRKHHCRNCGQVFCGQCTAKQCPLPKYGIEKEVRVCDGCFAALQRPTSGSGGAKSGPRPSDSELPAEYLNSTLAQQVQVSHSGKTANLIETEQPINGKTIFLLDTSSQDRAGTQGGGGTAAGAGPQSIGSGAAEAQAAIPATRCLSHAAKVSQSGGTARTQGVSPAAGGGYQSGAGQVLEPQLLGAAQDQRIVIHGKSLGTEPHATNATAPADYAPAGQECG